ncbi:hypothetical protein Kpol_473p5 [Vanderwaltozyma polyspora DSM 70294]|uniref:Uncharacterized protein n=1 Tax=Vanderwaltozyma polyspora (strain ATCC 22028 / DSM 70294 / BCRC 21397 / CBS 2163 / NBRC 10782 / NRRL Y-8283 / UCD 57-17) TaxID=436907 RepID=A7TPZ7_VANPO|nr:uncharacterized protein Kpol_473p5 [Vanderwaltozyma polyspora DSM 70294]EDO15646.1 hypothetical protein Kpol_473p5 [Vanderwaltozyma polyspora DSM 70294]
MLMNDMVDQVWAVTKFFFTIYQYCCYTLIVALSGPLLSLYLADFVLYAFRLSWYLIAKSMIHHKKVEAGMRKVPLVQIEKKHDGIVKKEDDTIKEEEEEEHERNEVDDGKDNHAIDKDYVMTSVDEGNDSDSSTTPVTTTRSDMDIKELSKVSEKNPSTPSISNSTTSVETNGTGRSYSLRELFLGSKGNTTATENKEETLIKRRHSVSESSTTTTTTTSTTTTTTAGTKSVTISLARSELQTHMHSSN